MENDQVITKYSQRNSFHFLHSIATPPKDVPIELHDHFELYFFVSGDMTFFIEGQSFELKKGDILTINTNELHRAAVESDKPYERFVIHFDLTYLDGFDHDDFKVVDFITKRKVGQFNMIDSSKFDTESIFALLVRIDELLNKNNDVPHAPLQVKARFIELLVALSEQYSDVVEESIPEGNHDRRVGGILKYLNKNLAEKVTLGDLEREFNMNRYYICHLFKQSTGFTVFEYLRNKRIMKAKRMLLSGSTVLDTCYSVGFNDYSSFSKAFKSIVGIPPKKFSMLN